MALGHAPAQPRRQPAPGSFTGGFMVANRSSAVEDVRSKPNREALRTIPASQSWPVGRLFDADHPLHPERYPVRVIDGLGRWRRAPVNL